MKTDLSNFISFVAERSKDNIASILTLHYYKIYGTCAAILVQEFDFLIKVCYLRTLPDKQEIEKLMSALINGSGWEKNGKKIMGEEMADIVAKSDPWIREMYDFCNSLTVMTNLYYYKYNIPAKNPDTYKQSILHYLKSYHQLPSSMEITYENIILYIPQVAEKLADNLKSYLRNLEQN